MINVEKIIAISLKSDLARQAQTEIELSKLKLKTDFFLVDRDPENRERGCFNSHVEVAKMALSNHDENILICEDDVHILSFTQKQIEAINHFLKKNQSFDVLYLGLIIDKMWLCSQYPIVRAKGAGLHAYILSRRGIEKMAASRYNGTPIDKIVKHDFKGYSIYPIIADQYPKHIAKSENYSQTIINEGEQDVIFWQTNLKKQKWILFKYWYKAFT